MTPLKNLKRRFSPPVLLISSLQPVDHIPYNIHHPRGERSACWICGSKVQRFERRMKSIPPQWIRSPQWRPVESTGVFELSTWASPSSLKHIFERFKTGSSKIPCTPTKINVYRYMESKKNQGKFGNQPFSGSKINLLGCMT